jgi:RNA polymerase sigma factor (sigma-70 family)
MSRAALALVRAVTPSPPDSDAQLLRAFLDARSEEAFAELVRRHGPMVLAACRRVLSNATDADDAFQATFLVLARKAHSVRGANVAGWLYGVAVRTARGVRLMRDRRLKRETRAARTDVARTPDEPRDADAAALVDAELARLPEHQREALVLCELQGRSRKAAAEELGIAEGTLSSRLAAAKRKLAERLSARGWRAFALGPVAVPAALASATSALARGAAHATAPASAAAAVVLKGMLFEQLRAGALACAVVLATVCGGFAMTGAPASDPPPAPRGAAADPAVELVKQLGSAEFAKRVAAEKELRKLGATAEPALRAGAKSDDPEVRARCAKLLVAVRKDALAELVRTFDAKTDAPSAHPVWKRFAATAGNTPASRALFARLLKHSDWVARLDAAETSPEEAARQYHAALADVSERVSFNMRVFFVIHVWPCDTHDEAGFLLFLGTYPGTEKPLPHDRPFVTLADSEARVTYARGLPLALQGKEIAPGPDNKYDATAALPEGSAKAFAKLLAAWLPRRAEPSPLFHGFELALASGAADVLPVARAIAGDAERPVASRLAALAAVAQFGEAADLKLFAPLFDDTTQLVIPPPPQNGDARPRSRRPVVADRAIGLALLLTDRDPADFGFDYAKGRFRRANGRPVVNAYEMEEFGFSSDEARAAAHKKAKAVLVEKVPKR